MATLAHDLRPKSFSGLVGQEKAVKLIQGIYKNGQSPKAWMFFGGTGTGKTTIARILALSLQCPTGKIGAPCVECQEHISSFSIAEVNASEIRKVEQIEDIAKGSVYVPLPPSLKRIVILDEAHGLSTASQKLLLKYFEDAPETTVWMVCTTEPNKILDTLKRRCQMVELKYLKVDGVERLVQRGLNHSKSTLPAKPLVNQLCSVKVLSPGLILNAVDKYTAGMDAKDSVRHLVIGFDSKAICIAMEKGDWDGVRKQVSHATPDDLRGIRAATTGYLRKVLQNMIPSPRARDVAAAITSLARVDSFTDATQGPATVAALYDLTQLFAGPKTEQYEDYEGEYQR